MKKELPILIFFILLASVVTFVNIFFSPEMKVNDSEAGGFGISPPYVQAEYLRAGDSFSQRIRVMRGDAGQAQELVVRTDSEEIADWL